MSNHASTAVPHRAAAVLGNALRRRVEQNARCIGAGRPSAGGRRPASHGTTRRFLAAPARAARPSAVSAPRARLGNRRYASYVFERCVAREAKREHREHSARVRFSLATLRLLAGPAEYLSAWPLGPCRHRLRPCRWRWRVWLRRHPTQNAGSCFACRPIGSSRAELQSN